LLNQNVPTDYILALVALTAGGLLGSYVSILLFDRVTKLPPHIAGYGGLAVWFALSSTGVWLRFTQADNALAGQHSRNVGLLVAYIAIWTALSVFGTLLGGALAGLRAQRRRL